IGPGLVSGDVEIVSGTSLHGGPLCPLDGGEGEGEGEGETCDDGKPAALTMMYTGDGCEASHHSQEDGKVVCSGDPNDAAQVQIVVTDRDDINDPKARIYFTGVVPLGGTFVIDAAAAGTTRLRTNTSVFVFDLSGNLLQSVKFHTSCSQPLILGDQYGALQLVGFTAEKGAVPAVMPRQVDGNATKAVGCGAGENSPGPADRGGDLLLVLLLSVVLVTATRRRQAVRC
ncbi:MAG: hypothetical protein HYZ00_09350, partial [Candidatus Hydrogenedentes bacterium]|nr:hypothetical protein [Candidatus Hydrogenedentota bacterium]